MELFLKYPIDVQEELLRRLVGVAQNTEIGRKYDFKSGGFGFICANRFNIRQSLRSVDFRLPCPQKIEVWPVDYVNGF